MQDSRIRHVVALFAGLALLLSASVLQAGAKVKVKGDVESVAEQIEGAFQELEIDSSDIEVSQGHATAVGKARSGARVTVSVNHSGDDECEVSVSSESPTDPDIEARFLRMMQSR